LRLFLWWGLAIILFKQTLRTIDVDCGLLSCLFNLL
jgi:hypothetical protein